jgi:hypothetical protein
LRERYPVAQPLRARALRQLAGNADFGKALRRRHALHGDEAILDQLPIYRSAAERLGIDGQQEHARHPAHRISTLRDLRAGQCRIVVADIARPPSNAATTRVHSLVPGHVAAERHHGASAR